jgi:HK97 family phage prohead protease
MTLEFKSAQSLTAVDANQGIAEAIVSVTNIVDHVGDKIIPGAYAETLKTRRPKVCWNHKWDNTVGKVLEIVELMPGDPRLPDKLKTIGAGALKVKVQFNLNSTRGRDAWEDVKFYGEEGEWSIGYDVNGPTGKSRNVGGVRELHQINLFEVSPVPFGAAPLTGTLALKSLGAPSAPEAVMGRVPFDNAVKAYGAGAQLSAGGRARLTARAALPGREGAAARATLTRFLGGGKPEAPRPAAQPTHFMPPDAPTFRFPESIDNLLAAGPDALSRAAWAPVEWDETEDPYSYESRYIIGGPDSVVTLTPDPGQGRAFLSIPGNDSLEIRTVGDFEKAYTAIDRGFVGKLELRDLSARNIAVLIEDNIRESVNADGRRSATVDGAPGFGLVFTPDGLNVVTPDGAVKRVNEVDDLRFVLGKPPYPHTSLTGSTPKPRGTTYVVPAGRIPRNLGAMTTSEQYEDMDRYNAFVAAGGEGRTWIPTVRDYPDPGGHVMNWPKSAEPVMDPLVADYLDLTGKAWTRGGKLSDAGRAKLVARAAVPGKEGAAARATLTRYLGGDKEAAGRMIQAHRSGDKLPDAAATAKMPSRRERRLIEAATNGDKEAVAALRDMGLETDGLPGYGFQRPEIAEGLASVERAGFAPFVRQWSRATGKPQTASEIYGIPREFRDPPPGYSTRQEWTDAVGRGVRGGDGTAAKPFLVSGDLPPEERQRLFNALADSSADGVRGVAIGDPELGVSDPKLTERARARAGNDLLSSAFTTAKLDEFHADFDGRKDLSDAIQSGTGSQRDPYITDNPEAAAMAIGKGRFVELQQPDELATMIDVIADWVNEAKAKGEKAPTYDLCRAMVKGTNLFCIESKGIPRIKMPQLSGIPTPGSPADSLPKRPNGEVDLVPLFLQHLASKGIRSQRTSVKASHLRASQNELNGGKVSGMVQSMAAGKLPPGSIISTTDNYVVDGHHRWAATIGTSIKQGDDLMVDTDQIDAPILQVLALANLYAVEMGIPPAGADAPVPQAKRFRRHGSLRKSRDSAPPCIGCGDEPDPIAQYVALKANRPH